MKERAGSSRQGITKYICANYEVDAVKAAVYINKALKKGLEENVFKKARENGKGAGRYRLVKKEKTVKTKRPVAKKSASKAAKPAAKKSSKMTKPVAKKPSKMAKPAVKKSSKTTKPIAKTSSKMTKPTAKKSSRMA